jgi:uncharacterized protein (DUF3820 family)
MSQRMNHERRNRTHKMNRQGYIDDFPFEFQKEYNKRQEATLMPFGKWEGRSLRFIFETDQSYLQWLMQQSWFKDKLYVLFDISVRMLRKLNCDVMGLTIE